MNNKTVPLTNSEITMEQMEQLKQKIAVQLKSAIYQDITKWVHRNVQEGLKRNNTNLFQLTGAIDKIVNYIIDEVSILLGFHMR
ncbi:hypothetical protein ACI2OX_04675 [Bacillus sp. N9]